MKPLAGDWLANGQDGIGLYDSANAIFNLRTSLTNVITEYAIPFGAPGDIPVAGHWRNVCPAVGGIVPQSGSCVQVPATITPTPTSTPTPTATPTSTPTSTQVPTAVGGCKVQIINTLGGNVRRGPSADDLLVIHEAQSAQFDAIARALDEDQQTWYGFYHPSLRSSYISWIVKTPLAPPSPQISQLSGTGCGSLPNLPTLPDTSLWGSALGTLQLPLQPMYILTTPFRGFGMGDDMNYPKIAQCRHNGFDFPANAASIPVYAVIDGIVVGMGSEHDSAVARPAAWGATKGGFNLIVRKGGLFVVYGHLASIEDSLYYGKRITAGTLLGTLAEQTKSVPGDDTHSHIQVSAFVSQADSTGSLRQRFGAVRQSGIANPLYVIDPVFYFPTANRGGNPSPAQGVINNCPSVSNGTNYPYTNYFGASLSNPFGIRNFDYFSRDDVALKCFHLTNGNIYNTPSYCNSPKP